MNCFHCGKPADCIDGWQVPSCWSCVYENPGADVEYLIQKANELCLQHWGVLFTGKVRMSKRRWTRSFALYYPSSETIAFCLWTNHRLPLDKVHEYLLHELVHWRLHTTGQPYQDHDEAFIRECLRVGASINFGEPKVEKVLDKIRREAEVLS